MGLFKKKKDPISERARSLNDQIASLQAQIERLSQEPAPEQPAAPPAKPPRPATQPLPLDSKKSRSPSPRLRSTALPQREAARRAQSKGSPAAASEPVFEELGPSAASDPPEPPPLAHYN